MYDLSDFKRFILYEDYKDGIHFIALRTQTSVNDIKKMLPYIKSPYYIKIITKDLTITKLGFKMVSRQCIGGIYVKQG